jgi:hypothetical protein
VLSPGLLTLWTRHVLEAARAGDTDLVAEVAARIADRADALDLAASCRVVADTARRALLALHGPLDAARGEAWVLSWPGGEGQPARLFAARLITAYCNTDHDTVTALAAAAAGASPVERAESLRALATYAAELDARAARHHHTEGTENS